MRYRLSFDYIYQTGLEPPEAIEIVRAVHATNGNNFVIKVDEDGTLTAECENEPLPIEEAGIVWINRAEEIALYTQSEFPAGKKYSENEFDQSFGV